MSHLQRAEEGDWVPSQVAGVLGKDLLSFPEGSAKWIRLLPGARYPRHQHPRRTEYAYVAEGFPTVTVADAVYAARPGDFVTFPTDTPHALENRGDREALLLVGAIYHRTDGVSVATAPQG